MAEKRKLYFLGDEDVRLPVGGEFTPTGYVGPISALILHKTSYTDREVPFTKSDGFKVDSKDGAKTAYYFKDYTKAAAAVKAMGGRDAGVYGSQEVWRFEIQKKDILNVSNEEFLERLKDLVSFEVDVMGLASKRRANFHMIALPMAVQAAALFQGHLTERVFSIEELTAADTVFTDEFEASYIGHPDAKKATDEGHYTQSIMWKRRAELWKALGETRPEVFAINSTNKSANTTSDVLAGCLSVAARTWNKPMWARLVLANDPHMGASFDLADGGEGRRKVPVLWEMFGDKGEAVAAADADKARFGGENAPAGESKPESKPAATNGEPALPSEWASMPEEFTSALADALHEGKKNKEVADELSCTVAEVAAWKKYLKL
jgi:hypothetical protein